MKPLFALDHSAIPPFWFIERVIFYFIVNQSFLILYNSFFFSCAKFKFVPLKLNVFISSFNDINL